MRSWEDISTTAVPVTQLRYHEIVGLVSDVDPREALSIFSMLKLSKFKPRLKKLKQEKKKRSCSCACLVERAREGVLVRASLSVLFWRSAKWKPPAGGLLKRGSCSVER